MIADVQMPPIDGGEWLSRFILYKSHIRQDRTLRPDPFISHPHADLSVTRHSGIDEKTLWLLGESVARQTGKPLHGRAETQGKSYQGKKLSVVLAPVVGNPNHANVVGWPADKAAQKMLALKIATESCFLPKSEGP